MRVKTRVFNLSRSRFNNQSQLASAIGVSVSQVYRVKEGSWPINQRFIVGAARAFPRRRLGELFYLED